MPRAAILEKYAGVIDQSNRDRAAVRKGLLDEADLVLRRRRDLRVTLRLVSLFPRGRFDLSRWASAVADLSDDGLPDWVYWLDNPLRRYRLRPWRAEDGSPWSYMTPCVTVMDGETGRKLCGIPAGAYLLRGQKIMLRDTDACCAALFVNAKSRGAVQ